MKARKDDKIAARDMRRNGMSVRDIAISLKVSKSSISQWVRDVRLSEAQEKMLSGRRASTHCIATKALVDKHREWRETCRDEGREKARKNDLLHLMGCMLYWGEGSKRRNYVAIVNSDGGMLFLFVRFLREALGVKPEDIGIRVACYTGNGLSVREIEDWWVERLGLMRSCLKKTQVDTDKRWTSGRKIGKRPYGACCVEVCRTDLAQHICGAIAEYAGMDRVEWQD